MHNFTNCQRTSRVGNMTLYVVATPIGNLSDCSPRAKKILDEATLIIAEDTRSIKKLLSLLSISIDKTFLSSHAQSTGKELEKALETCREHEVIALVTDAGTPAISDPGSFFISEFYNHYPQSLVVPVPGPSAVTTALSVCGFPVSHFEFLGFIPHKKGRKTIFEYIQNSNHVIIFYESPHRILKTLESLQILGDRPIMVGREMTKQFEEYPRWSAAELLQYYQSHQEKIKGEFVIVVSPVKKGKN